MADARRWFGLVVVDVGGHGRRLPLVIYGVFWLARNTGSQAPDEGARESPEEVLKRRLAAGEISVDECKRLRRAMADGEPVEPRAPALA